LPKKQKLNTKLVFLAAALLLVIIVLVFVFYYQIFVSTDVVLLDAKPELQGQFIKNPDIIHSSFGWLSAIPENRVSDEMPILNVSSDWSGNGFVGFNINDVNGRHGVAILHPLTEYVGRYIEQSVLLPDSGTFYKMNIGIANVVDTVGSFDGACADSGIKVKIISKAKTYTVFDEVVKNGRWYDYSVDLGDKFSGDYVTVRIESYTADDGCGFWNGEFSGVDYIDIVRV